MRQDLQTFVFVMLAALASLAAWFMWLSPWLAKRMTTQNNPTTTNQPG